MIIVVKALTMAACGLLLCPPFLHALQLDSYVVKYYLRRLPVWFFKANSALWLRIFVAVVAVLVCVPAYTIFSNLTVWPALGILLLTCAAAYMAWKRTPAKKPLVFTARVQRLSASVAIVHGAFGLLPMPWAVVPLALTPFIVALAAYAMHPIEEGIKAWYFRDAQRMLEKRQDLIRIGVTGSYGKTSVKFILAAILGEKFNVLATRESFNTPMGLTRVVREQLLPEHQVFIAEMGARHKGDIAELCNLVHPQYGLITSVGPQHLETFGSVEVVASTKYELIAALPPDGAAFFAGDGGIVDDLFSKTKAVTAFRSGLEGEPLSVTAQNIEVGPGGSTFTLKTADGQTVNCRTRLLGRHNIGNILLCACVALKLGLSLQEVARGIEKAQPVEHRLQLLPTDNGICVIDDAFNASPNGARAALAVLAAFSGKKIIVTPGLVELGAREADENKAFGAAMAKVCDEVILVGKQRAALMLPGLVEANFPQEHVHVVPGIEGATQAIARLAKPGDCVLFENDLPDNIA